jgi:uncharacterized membrane protein YbhN (UPF0104 family)
MTLTGVGVKGLRALLFVGGLGLAAWLIRGVGVARILDVLGQTWPWMPLVVLLELLFVSMDLVSLRVLLGDASHGIPPRVWVRSSVVAYATTILVPGGRAAGEVARATALSSVLGATDAAATCTRLQACALLGNAGISSIIVTVLLASGGSSSGLSPLLFGNAVVCASIAAGLLLALLSGRLATWLKRKLHRFELKGSLGGLKTSRGQVAAAAACSVVGGCAGARARARSARQEHALDGVLPEQRASHVAVDRAALAEVEAPLHLLRLRTTSEYL